MKRQNKKGFTIVELVIVIAVIAILAAVLIPTFSSVIKKAKISADTQVVRNMNTTLSVDEVVNGKPENFGEVISALKEDGYVISNLNPTTNGWFYVWESTTNQILLVDEAYNVKFASKENYPALGASWYFAISNETVANKVAADCPTAKIERTVGSVSDLSSAVTAGGEKTVYIDENISFDSNSDAIVVSGDKASDITVDLGKSDFKVDKTTAVIPMQVTGNNELTLTGGKITGAGIVDSKDEGKKIEVLSQAKDGATLTMKDTEISVSVSSEDIVLPKYSSGSVTSSIYSGSTATLDNVKANILNGTFLGIYGGGNKATLKNCNVNIASNPNGFHVVFFGNQFDDQAKYPDVYREVNHQENVVTIESGKYAAYWLATFEPSQKATLNIEGGEFTFVNHVVGKAWGATIGGQEKVSFFKMASKDAKVVITGGTFQGVNWYDITAEQWVNAVSNTRPAGYNLVAEITGTGANTVVTLHYVAK